MRELPIEIFSRILGGGFFFGYVVYHVLQRVNKYQQLPQGFTFSNWMNWSLIMVLFLLFGVSYVIRRTPIAAASRPREIFLPLLCAIMPLGINESVRWIKPYNIGAWNDIAPFFILFGDCLMVLSMVYLKNSFSILTEVRNFVRSGPYRWVRHPLYVGEITATIGFCIFLFSWVNVFLTLAFIVCLWLRASFEEAKITPIFPEYAEYKKTTGMFFPKF
ncbi:MAG: hypothetical protein HY877_03335 [Deltaproteobacteria bacterium]|nr:hypothetical protein [Deltaproteobacteria bacterium]